ncbi:MAG: hypothetical protein R2713_15790 [Ilumatobacteraceae bacterium]|jgi:hypothetical protein|nr:hypothetical protein [Acidimicrobiales bacterium]MCB9394865.1 hypothetical protein [Acidimicrobiaceae bacterium]
MTLDELIAASGPLLRDHGWAFYFTPETRARGAELGLDPMQFYVLGRGGVLGDVDASVVASAFGYFKPALIAGVWNAAREKVSPRDAGREFMACCAAHGRAKLGAVDGLAEFVAAAEKVNAAADPDALALYAATAAEPLADDLPARAMQLVTVLREHRGSAHLVAVRAVGLDSRTAHHAKRPDDAKMFGWAPDEAPVVDDLVQAKMAEAETLTDRIVAPAFAVLDEAERDAFVHGLERLAAALAA